MDASLMRQIKIPKSDSSKELEFLKEAVDKFFQLDFKNLRYQDLFQAGYKLVVSQHGDKLYSELGEWLYVNMQILATRIRPVEEPVAFLKNIKELWTTANTAITITCQILIYLDTQYLKKRNLVSIKDLGYKYFSDIVMKNAKNVKRITGAVLNEVEKERDGELINRNNIKNISEMILNISETTGEKIYNDHIEAPYISQLRESSEVICRKLLTELSVPSFLEEAEKLMAREAERAKELLMPISQEKVLECIRAAFIESNTPTILANDVNWLETLIQQNRLDDVSRVYRLYSNKIRPEIFAQFVGTLQHLLVGIGEKQIQQAIAEHSWLKMIDAILVLSAKYNSMLNDQFQRNPEIVKVIHKVLVHVVNFDESICKALAFYFNHLLSESAPQISEAEYDHRADGLLEIFKRVRAKDSFSTYYVQLMAKRLLAKTLKSDDSERAVIRKFKAECGIQYTLKMESMMKDVVVSHDECTEFLDAHENLPFQFDIFILTNGLWSFANLSVNCAMPPQLEGVRKSFENFYLGKHKGRKLVWRMNKSTLELVGSFAASNQRYFFTAYMMEAMILLAFNEFEEVSVEQLKDMLKAPCEVLERSLTLLSKIKLLLHLKDRNSYTLNAQYRSRTIKVRIPSSEKALGDNEGAEGISVELRREREQKIDATLVKIMKGRHQVLHNTLIEDAAKMLSASFPPDTGLIKLRIEYLIEAEYIKRSPSDRKLYIYLSLIHICRCRRYAVCRSRWSP
eukprot:TRINITY_DN15109_c0_g1_i3.p1 TRINITY_DN15109_c0_g1~~TRINITY_DN15109_c0_g1_i3.p1  ORF type:complete len:767 (+),score=174.98 TRINITY_DN15109_c0_g1_i3:79-2301(+)